MNLNTIEEVRGATAVVGGSDTWREGDSWLAGGTWLYSEPQPHLRRLFDLRDLGWQPLKTSDAGLRIAATCRIADLYAFQAPPEWTAAPMIDECCRAFLASFKIWNTATGTVLYDNEPGAADDATAVTPAGCGSIVIH